LTRQLRWRAAPDSPPDSPPDGPGVGLALLRLVGVSMCRHYSFPRLAKQYPRRMHPPDPWRASKGKDITCGAIAAPPVSNRGLS
jgi:hypothetical protein